MCYSFIFKVFTLPLVDLLVLKFYLDFVPKFYFIKWNRYFSASENFPNSSCHFWKYVSVFLHILHQYSVLSNITPLYFLAQTLYTLVKKEPIKVQIFETFECLDQNLTNSCQFWNDMSIALQILHHSSVLWDTTPLYFFKLKFYILSAKEDYESTNLVKFHMSSWKSEILHFNGFLFSESHKVSAKKVQNSYLSWHWSVMQSLMKN